MKRFVRKLRGSDSPQAVGIIQTAAAQLTLRQVDPLIRELTEYRDFINLKLKEQPG